MRFQNFQESILIIDFGSQVTKLIARRVRELGVYSEIVTPKELKKIKDYSRVKGIIFSGGPSSVTKNKYQSVPKYIFTKKIPVLGICYGLQLISKLYGGKIKSSNKQREFGRAFIHKKSQSLLTKNFFNSKTAVWMSHEDAVIKLPKGFKSVAFTKDSKLTIIENKKENIYGVQFHPEKSQIAGEKLIENFLNLK